MHDLNAGAFFFACAFFVIFDPEILGSGFDDDIRTPPSYAEKKTKQSTRTLR
jgi:hypothetical protein